MTDGFVTGRDGEISQGETAFVWGTTGAGHRSGTDGGSTHSKEFAAGAFRGTGFERQWVQLGRNSDDDSSDRLERLEATLERKDAELEALWREYGAWRDDNEKLRARAVALEAEIESVQADNARLRAQNQALRDRTERLEARLDRLESHVSGGARADVSVADD